MKLKLIRINVNRKYLWAFRIVIFLAAAPFHNRSLSGNYELFKMDGLLPQRKMENYFIQ
jgi:hypothetical protein